MCVCVCERERERERERGGGVVCLCERERGGDDENTRKRAKSQANFRSSKIRFYLLGSLNVKIIRPLT